MGTVGDPDSGIVNDLAKKKLLVLSVSICYEILYYIISFDVRWSISWPVPQKPKWKIFSAANLGRNVEPIAMPETTEEYQKEFDLLIKQVQCKGMSSKKYRSLIGWRSWTRYLIG